MENKMQERIESFVNAMIYTDIDGKITFPFMTLKEDFFVNANDRLTELPVKGSVSVECSVRDDTIEIDYMLLEVTKTDNNTLEVTYVFNS